MLMHGVSVTLDSMILGLYFDSVFTPTS